MIKSLIASLLLTGCTTSVKVHVPIKCLPVPNHSVVFTDSEVNVLSKSVLDDGRLVVSEDKPSLLDKFEQIVTIYKQRITTNCELVESHNKLHEVK